jgi:hypothetical protein
MRSCAYTKIKNAAAPDTGAAAFRFTSLIGFFLPWDPVGASLRAQCRLHPPPAEQGGVSQRSSRPQQVWPDGPL